MGMDVYGKKPKTEKGEYFRNNVWWWHPLWDYCEHIAPEIATKVQYAHDNSGDGLNAIDSRKLGFILKKSVEDGAAAEYVDSYYKKMSSLPEEPCFCRFVNMNDYFKYRIEPLVSLFEAYDKEGPIPFPLQFEQCEPKRDCNSCKGTGNQQSFELSYHISVENIFEFSEFLIDCGGFQIC